MKGYEIVAYLDIELFEKMKQKLNCFMAEVHRERDEHHGELFQYDISKVIDLCSHLSLKEGYRLFSFSHSEMHGDYGNVVAMREDETSTGFKINPPGKFDRYSEWFFPEAEKAVINPLSVIRGDLSPESFVEAYALSKLFEALPRLAFRYQYSVIDSNPFDNIKKEWNVFSPLADWRPVLLNHIGYFEYEMRLCETRELPFNMHAIATYSGVFYNTMCFKNNCILCEGCEGYPYEIDRWNEIKDFSAWNDKEKYKEYEKQRQCYSPTKSCSIMLGCENKKEDNSIRCYW